MERSAIRGNPIRLRHRPRISLRSIRATLLRLALHHHAPRQRQSHQHKRRRHLGPADQNPRRRLHLVPFIGLVRPMPAAFAEMGGDAVQRRREGRNISAEMRQRHQRQRGVERVHLARDQFSLDIGQHFAADERERAVRIDRLPRRIRQRHERGMAAAEIGGVEFRQIIDVRARISERAAFDQPPLEADDAMHRLQPRRRLQNLPAL